MASISAPLCTVIAGPNGSGKSSVYEMLEPPGEFVNVDVLARDARLGAIGAGRRAIDRLRELRGARADVVFETTLSSAQSLTLMRDMREAGYAVDLAFVFLSSVDLHLRRVAARVRMGGHDIPSVDVRRRYARSIRNLATAIPLATTCTILDNSRSSPEVLLRISDGHIEASRLDVAQRHHVSIAEAVAEALSLTSERILDTARRR